jgi:hypothetical protein
MANARASKGLLYPPVVTENPDAQTRKQWLSHARENFVCSPANKAIYGMLLEMLWPPGHGIPGPHVSEKAIRQLLDQDRLKIGKKPYVDPFRRMRELQGEEGFTCIIKEGSHYQLQHLDVGPKREPRQKPLPADWKKIKANSANRCSHCGKQEPDIKLSPDHRVPRSRGGDNSLANWQPLCEQCNNLKSSACSGCNLNCRVCSWAYPETYKPIVISDDNKELIRREAEKLKISQADFANKVLRAFFNR